MVTKESVMKALKKVLDPEIGIDVVELGLVYNVDISNGEVRINMTLTSPGCPMASEIMASAETSVGRLKGVKKVKVEFVFDPPWTPEKLSAVAKKELGI